MPSTITPAQFVKRWSQIQLRERASSQSHFLDICALVGHKPPMEADPKGQFFTFEAEAEQGEGERGWADAWYKNHFIWEYKGPHKNLQAAYQQLLRYKDSLGNPPLLITSDMQVIEIHTNFTNTVKKTYLIPLDKIASEESLGWLHAAFFEPEKLKPALTQEQVTQATAQEFVAVANALRKWQSPTEAALSPEQSAHFLIRLLFCLFAEDIRLLPYGVFAETLKASLSEIEFEESLRQLFAAMRGGGAYGYHRIAHFNGRLFDDSTVPHNMPSDVRTALRRACDNDWSNIDPSIFGTLFERIIDESKRAQLGAHYTSKDDILLVVEPVLMQPLREKWQNVKLHADRLLRSGAADDATALLSGFSAEIAATRVLDPACGSGNFLYLALRQLLDLQKDVIVFAARYGLPAIPLSAGPQQIHGIEVNTYAHELAQATVWIGYLQWRYENGFAEMEEPILRPLQQIECRDAIIDLTGDIPREPAWPQVDVIIGNPPFLGDKKMRSELGDAYVDALRSLYAGRIPGQSDLVCYWFEKARAQIENGEVKRAGLLATNSIRGGANRTVLERIKDTGDIFWAQSDRDWFLDGAAVNVSMIGFDDGTETEHRLDEAPVPKINADLSAASNLTLAAPLSETAGIAYIGTQKGGNFDISASMANQMLADKNGTDGRLNSAVLRPWINALDITGRPRNMWIVDFGSDMMEQEAAQYKMPFEYVLANVKQTREAVHSEGRTASLWWLFQRPRPEMRISLSRLGRYIATPRVSKYRVFVWQDVSVLPDSAVVAIVRDDDYFFGVLHSRIHEMWALGLGTSLEDRPRYTPSTTFDTYPFPWPPGKEAQDDRRVQAIAAAAKQLDDMRNTWLNPPAAEIGVTIAASLVARRTLTNLYNALTLYREQYRGKQRFAGQWKTAMKDIIELSDIEMLDHIHASLDNAVLDAYGWPHNLSDEQILERLLALNLQRAGAG